MIRNSELATEQRYWNRKWGKVKGKWVNQNTVLYVYWVMSNEKKGHFVIFPFLIYFKFQTVFYYKDGNGLLTAHLGLIGFLLIECKKKILL